VKKRRSGIRKLPEIDLAKLLTEKKSKRLNIYLQPSLHKFVEWAAGETDVDMNTFIRYILIKEARDMGLAK